jgi:hypothetical protein
MLTGMAKPLARMLHLLRPRRRWAQFSIRGALVALTLFCAALAQWIVPAERQRRAVAAIHAAGGRTAVTSRMRMIPTVVKRWLPRDYLIEVQEVFL